MIEAENITVQAGKATLLSGVSVSLQAGDMVAVVGPNGAGKSTLLKALCGDLPVSHGAVRLEEKPLTDWPRPALAKRRAVLPQQSLVAFPFSVHEIVLMGRAPHLQGGAETAADYRIVREALQAVDMLDFEHRIYTTLSGGERQRVQIARVLTQIRDCRASSFLLLDEPVSALDLAHQHSVLKLVREFAQAGTGVLVVLHDLNLALQYCDQVWVLKSGRLQAAGEVHQMLTAALIESVFDVPVEFIKSKRGRRVVAVV